MSQSVPQEILWRVQQFLGGRIQASLPRGPCTEAAGKECLLADSLRMSPQSSYSVVWYVNLDDSVLACVRACRQMSVLPPLEARTEHAFATSRPKALGVCRGAFAAADCGFARGNSGGSR